MKKLFAVLLAAMMLLAMVACGNDTPDPTPTPDPRYQDAVYGHRGHLPSL